MKTPHSLQVENAAASPAGEPPASDLRHPASTTGRPSHFTESTVHTLCAIIREHGMSDSAAAAVIGIAPSTLSRWKSTQPGFAEQLASARELFRIDQINLIRHACTRDGRHDWRAAAWLLERIFPEDYARRRPAPAEDAPLPPEPPELEEPSTPTHPQDSTPDSTATPASSRLAGATSPSPQIEPGITLASVFQNSRNPAAARVPITGPILPQKLTIPVRSL